MALHPCQRVAVQVVVLVPFVGVTVGMQHVLRPQRLQEEEQPDDGER